MKLKALAITTTILVSLNVTSAQASSFDLTSSWNDWLKQLSGVIMCSGGGKGDDPLSCSGVGKGTDSQQKSGGGKGDDPK